MTGKTAPECPGPVLLEAGPASARRRLLLAHGAGAAMDSPFMSRITELIVDQGLAVTRFEFAYMAARRSGAARRPPPRAELLLGEYRAAIEEVRRRHPDGLLAIGGKSMGGRVASMIADEEADTGRAAALVCLGYPFHPPGKPGQLRTAHLGRLAMPTLIVQGERDPFGHRAEVQGLLAAGGLSPAVSLHWAIDGDHDLGPRGGSGTTRRNNLEAAAEAIGRFLLALTPAQSPG